MTRLLAHLGLFAVALIYGANYVVAKDVMGDGVITPFAFILCRCIVGALLFWVVGLTFVQESIDRSDIPKFLLAGLLGVAINQLCFFSGLDLTSPIHASLIMIMTPIIIVVGSAVWLREKISVKRWIGILVGFAGAAILILQGNAASSGSSWQGDILIFVNASSYACYLLLIKTLVKKYHPLTVVRWAYTFGMFMVLPIAGVDLSETAFTAFTGDHWLAFAYVMLFTTFLAYLLNAVSINYLSPSTVGAYIYLQPLLATIIATLAGADVLDAAALLAAALIFSGIYLVTGPARQESCDA